MSQRKTNGHRFAASEGIETLYKFRAYSTPQERQFVREILVDHKVWFSRPSGLKDVRDLRPEVHFRGADDAEIRRLLLAEAETTWARRKLEQSEVQRTRGWWTTAPLRELERYALQRVHARLEECYWIFSLCASRDFLPMWEEYADHGRGLCIHFARTASLHSATHNGSSISPRRRFCYCRSAAVGTWPISAFSEKLSLTASKTNIG